MPETADVMGMSDLSEFEQVQILRDPVSGARAVVALHDTRMGPAFGGIRRWNYPDLSAATADVLRLARAMTYKCALAGLPAGGGKTVLLDDGHLDRRRAYEFVGDFVEQFGGRYFSGPDVGTTDADLRVVSARTRFSVDPDRDGFAGIADSTAQGVFEALVATVRVVGLEVAGAKVLVQGLGSVGMRLCGRLAAAGAVLLVADVDAERCAAARRDFDATPVAVDEVLTTACDVLAPCALGGLLSADAARVVACNAVCGAANNVLVDAAAGLELHRRQIPCAPDFVANAGGLIHGATLQLTGALPPEGRLGEIGATLTGLYEQSRALDLPPMEVAEREARRLLQAVPARPWLPARRGC